ncbi:MAG: acetyltransferase [Alphaproteobacteria bacterium]|nr:acetyltransferase [Alphaproteobacteria bacterium]
MLPFDYRAIARPVFIGDNVWIGMHSLILPGVKIEEGAIVAAGSVVTKSVPTEMCDSRGKSRADCQIS